MGVITVKIKFNPGSRSAKIEKVIKLAEDHKPEKGMKSWTVTFAKHDDPDIRKMVELLYGGMQPLAGSDVLVNDESVYPWDVIKTFFCKYKVICKGTCFHYSIGHERLPRFLDLHRDEIRDDQLETPNTMLLDYLLEFLEGAGDQTFELQKTALTQAVQDALEFQAAHCPFYKEAKLKKIIDQLPKKLVLRPTTPKDLGRLSLYRVKFI